ncbi:MAG: disulfide bond formation protein B [Pseudomonadota bacterium]
MFGYRSLAFVGLALCIASMLFAVLYLERTLYLDPCPLCVLDRVVIIALGVVFLFALLHGPRTVFSKIYGAICILLSAVGIGLASRHIWLQNLPKDQVPECGPDLYYMLDTLPLFDVLRETLTGSGSCADISWTFLDLTIPEQTLILFVILLILSIFQTLLPLKSS